jgi:hypothetical protein
MLLGLYKLTKKIDFPSVPTGASMAKTAIFSAVNAVLI